MGGAGLIGSILVGWDWIGLDWIGLKEERGRGFGDVYVCRVGAKK